MIRSVAAAAAVVLMAATACGKDESSSDLDWQQCTHDQAVDCATLTVPLDWDAPAGPDNPTVDLALARLPATGDRIGSLVTNPGGPGGSGLEFLGYAPFEPPVTQRFDIVSWDPRGVGRSAALRCGDRTVPAFLSQDSAPDSPEEQAGLEQAAHAVSEDCGSEDLDLLEHLGTRDVARDLEAIRLALGGEPLNYVGFSYGTQIGQQYAEMFPGSIRSMVLDGVVDPAEGFTEFLLGQANAFDASFDSGAATCARVGRSRCGVKDLGAAYDELAAQVERNPLTTAGTDVGPAELAVAAIYSLYSPDGWRDLGAALAAALDDGDGDGLSDMARAYYDFGGYPSYAAVVCIDTPPPAGTDAFRSFADDAQRVSPRFGAAVANELLPCATWPVPPVGTPGPLTAPGAPPILVVGNTGDPATPYDNAVTVADQLSSGVLVTAEINGHTAYGTDRCVTDLVDRYLIDLTVPPDGSRCG